jgi:hypothetical protein
MVMLYFIRCVLTNRWIKFWCVIPPEKSEKWISFWVKMTHEWRAQVPDNLILGLLTPAFIYWHARAQGNLGLQANVSKWLAACSRCCSRIKRTDIVYMDNGNVDVLNFAGEKFRCFLGEHDFVWINFCCFLSPKNATLI